MAEGTRLYSGTATSSFDDYTAYAVSGVEDCYFGEVTIVNTSEAGTLEVLSAFTPRNTLLADTPATADASAGPYALTDGQVLTVNGDTATFNGAAGYFQPVANQNYNMNGGKTWTVSVNGGAAQTITFVNGDFANPLAGTAAEVLAVLDAQLVGTTNTAVAGPKWRATSNVIGTGGTVVSTGGTVPWAANPSVSGTGDAVTLAAVTEAEAKVVIEADIADVVFDTTGDAPVLRTTASGAAAELDITVQTADLGFVVGTYNGADEGTTPYKFNLLPGRELELCNKTSKFWLRGTDVPFSLAYTIVPRAR